MRSFATKNAIVPWQGIGRLPSSTVRPSPEKRRDISGSEGKEGGIPDEGVRYGTTSHVPRFRFHPFRGIDPLPEEESVTFPVPSSSTPRLPLRKGDGNGSVGMGATLTKRV